MTLTTPGAVTSLHCGVGVIIMDMKFIAAAMAGALALSCAVVEQARAVTVYTYTGNNFPSGGIEDVTPPNGAYTTSMSVTGSFTLQNPLSANLPLTDITADILSFSFSDGRHMFTNLNAGIPFLIIGTNPLGNIDAWDVRLVSGSGHFPDVGSQRWQIDSDSGSDVVQTRECIVTECAVEFIDSAIVRPGGTWSVSTAETPLPAALPLFTGGLGVIGLLAHRRKRRIQAAKPA
jgi:hypothetical protein